MPTEVEYRRRIREVMPTERLRALSVPSVRDTTLHLVAIWSVTIALLVAGSFVDELPTVWAVLASVAIALAVTTRVNALSVVIHEAAHGLLAPRRSTNDRIGNLAAAWWIFNSVEGYRGAHLLHHRYLHTDRDPDLDSYLLPDSTRGVLTLVASDLLGITAVRRALLLKQSADTEGAAAERTSLLGPILCQLVLLGGFVALEGVAVGILFYVVFWAVPNACLFPLLLRWKTVTEHFHDDLRRGADGAFVSRTNAAGPLQDWLIGARMQYHFEHHALPAIPFRGLRRLHRELTNTGFFDEFDDDSRTRVDSGGYLAYTRTVRSDRARPKDALPVS